jgi:hypothetical protein
VQRGIKCPLNLYVVEVVPPKQPWGKDEVPARRNGQELGKALNQA